MLESLTGVVQGATAQGAAGGEGELEIFARWGLLLLLVLLILLLLLLPLLFILCPLPHLLSLQAQRGSGRLRMRARLRVAASGLLPHDGGAAALDRWPGGVAGHGGWWMMVGG